MTNLVPGSDEHEQAKVLAYMNCLTRGDGYEPIYDPDVVDSDFCAAADQVVAWRSPDPSLYRPDPEEHDGGRKRAIPVALDRFPDLAHPTPQTVDQFIASQRDMKFEEYWSLLGHIWTRNIKPKDASPDLTYAEKYRKLLSQLHPGKTNLMTPGEHAALQGMAETLTIYRACCQGKHEDGLSWTLSPEKAGDWCYTYLSRCSEGRQVLVGTCFKKDVVAYFDYDKEREVLIFPENRTILDKLDYYDFKERYCKQQNDDTSDNSS